METEVLAIQFYFEGIRGIQVGLRLIFLPESANTSAIIQSQDLGVCLKE